MIRLLIAASISTVAVLLFASCDQTNNIPSSAQSNSAFQQTTEKTTEKPARASLDYTEEEVSEEDFQAILESTKKSGGMEKTPPRSQDQKRGLAKTASGVTSCSDNYHPSYSTPETHTNRKRDSVAIKQIFTRKCYYLPQGDTLSATAIKTAGSGKIELAIIKYDQAQQNFNDIETFKILDFGSDASLVHVSMVAPDSGDYLFVMFNGYEGDEATADFYYKKEGDSRIKLSGVNVTGVNIGYDDYVLNPVKQRQYYQTTYVYDGADPMIWVFDLTNMVGMRNDDRPECQSSATLPSNYSVQDDPNCTDYWMDCSFSSLRSRAYTTETILPTTFHPTRIVVSGYSDGGSADFIMYSNCSEDNKARSWQFTRDENFDCSSCHYGWSDLYR